MLAALLTTVLAALTAVLAALAGILRLLAWLLLLAALLLTGLRLAALVRVLRVLAHTLTPMGPRPVRQRLHGTNVPAWRGDQVALVHKVESAANRCLVKGEATMRF